MPFINGVYMAAPGVSVTVNDSSFTSPQTGTGQGVILIGSATDGEPNTPISVTNAGQAAAQVKGGPLLQAALNLFAGVSGTSGPSQVVLIRPEQATQATSTIDDASAAAQITLTTTSYGEQANLSKWMVQAGTTSGYNVTQATDFIGPAGQTYAAKAATNVALPVLSLAYTGPLTSPLATITDSLFTLTGTSGATTGTVISSVSLTSSTTVQGLVNQLNQTSGVSAAVLDPNPGDITNALFDNVADAAVSVTGANPTTFSADTTAVVRWFNASPAYFLAARAANATSLATSNAWTYASGGTTPTPATSDWQNAYTTAQSVVGITLIAPVSSSPVLWAMNDAHCHYMASQGRPRRGYLGDVTGQTIQAEQAAAAALNSNRSTLVWPEQQGVDYNGNPTTFAPYLVAPFLMGMRSSTAPNQSLTLHQVKSDGSGQAVPPSTVQSGLAGGVCVLYTSASGNVVVGQDRTTWLQSSAYDKVENSSGLVADIISVDLNETLQAYVSQPMTVATVGGAKAAVLSRLVYWYDKGYLAAAPQASDVTMTGSGDAITGGAQAAIDVPTNYIVFSLTPTAVSASS